MTRTLTASTILALRIPRSLHRQLRIHCVERGVHMQDFVTEVVREKLACLERRPARPARSNN
jgi:hypothetical protein